MKNDHLSQNRAKYPRNLADGATKSTFAPSNIEKEYEDTFIFGDINIVSHAASGAGPDTL